MRPGACDLCTEAESAHGPNRPRRKMRARRAPTTLGAAAFAPYDRGFDIVRLWETSEFGAFEPHASSSSRGPAVSHRVVDATIRY